MIDVLENIESFYGVEGAWYAKRHRDDPVNLTSLSQELKDEKFVLYFDQYFKVKDILAKKQEKKFKILSKHITIALYKYYYYRYSLLFLNNKKECIRTVYFDKICEISKDFD